MGDEFRIIWLLAIGLGLACLFGYIAQKLKQTPTIGYLVAGYLIGPNSPGFVADAYISDQLANIGVTLLMFAVGLSFSWKDLIAVKKVAVPGALALATISFLTGAFYSSYMGEQLLTGFVVGIAICVSSTVVIVRVLSDVNLLHTKQGHLAVGWTIVEDLISVSGLLLLPVFVSIYTFSGSSASDAAFEILLLLAKITLFGVIIYSFGGKFVEAILKVIARTRSHELFTLAILSTTFLIAVGSSQLFGVSVALGAFIAGTIVGRTDMSYQAAANALPMRDAFSVIFFLSVGMLFSPAAILDNLPFFFGLMGILLLLRPLIAFLIVKIAKKPSMTALTVACAIAQIGEYSFIVAEEGSGLGILPDNIYDVLIAAAFSTIALNPFLFKLIGFIKSNKKNYKGELSEEFSLEQIKTAKHGKPSFLPRVIVIGFGPIGQKIAQEMLSRDYHVTIVDQNIDSITLLRDAEVENIFGDATQFHILEKAQTENAQLLVVTIPNFQAVRKIIQAARDINPHIKIIARVQFQSDLQDNSLQDVSVICDEESSSEKLTSFLKEIL
ncbi:cation:proton antiporter [Waddlia chondrophila]|uniref:Putative monovalent cation transporter, sodium/hydrogen exchanger family n=1 Tax=Waddlia chondrophila (strain ATCC VR-1470 / WSU 86-1044) TaxID=716544 RepID=D6YTX6_WADCW|nr:cation:proton antiporter [Waddlia chondrophila]ADI37587.1 putative monovalent cation transporter, sodium/hydrogen exchanger family [Waddlia chondrophila WSU 86-1044]